MSGHKNPASKILIVDDTQLMVAMLTDYLSQDHEIHSANSGEQALDMIEKVNPDLILLDVLMPHLSGIDVCKILKNNEKTLGIPIIMVTALSQPQDRIQCIEAGADDFISKPVDKLELTTRVKSLLRIKRLQDKLVAERDSLDLKNDILSVMTEIIPVFMRTMPIEQQKILILQMIDRVEQIIWNKLELDPEKHTMTYLGDIVCNLWNQLGGNFIVEIRDKKNAATIRGTICPWGMESKSNPVLCQLTRGVFSRIALKVFPEAHVDLIKTMGNREECCLIEMSCIS